jgi:hypothetical protein
VFFLLYKLFILKHCLHTYYGLIAFFINLFWLSKFYFGQFNHNSKSTAFDLLSKSGIGRRGTKMKKTPKIVGDPDFW